jgi:hypothetical protein
MYVCMYGHVQYNEAEFYGMQSCAFEKLGHDTSNEITESCCRKNMHETKTSIQQYLEIKFEVY